MKLSKRGAVDSKYFSKLDQFEKDVEAKIIKRAEDKEGIKLELLKLIQQDPAQIERSYKLVIESLIEIKNEYDL